MSLTTSNRFFESNMLLDASTPHDPSSKKTWKTSPSRQVIVEDAQQGGARDTPTILQLLARLSRLVSCPGRRKQDLRIQCMYDHWSCVHAQQGGTRDAAGQDGSRGENPWMVGDKVADIGRWSPLKPHNAHRKIHILGVWGWTDRQKSTFKWRPRSY